MLFTSLTLPNGRILKNRVVKSGLSEALCDSKNNPTNDLISIFKRWSQGGAGLLITGNIMVDRWHLEHAANFVLDQSTNLTKASELANAAKIAGSLVLAQLSHAGRQTPKAINSTPLSISNLKLDLQGYGQPRVATEQDLISLADQFSSSAKIAEKCGFDGVEIHAAHGYLLSSSISPKINNRSDKWGGSVTNRTRLLQLILQRIRSAVSKDFIVAVKLNSSDFQHGGLEISESVQIASIIEKEKIDFIEVSGGNFESPKAYQYISLKESTKTREAYFLDAAKNIKEAVGIPVMVTGGFRSRSIMEEALSSSATDLIGIGRPFIIDPSFPNKLFSGVMSVLPTNEQNFPPAQEIPKGAVLNWFCDQLRIQGKTGRGDTNIPLLHGHNRYLEQSDETIRRLILHRKNKK